jgi:phosphomannomutase
MQDQLANREKFLMSSDHKLFGAYDIRGIYGNGLDEGFARKVGQAYGAYLKPNGGGRILVGYDARSSSPSLRDSFVEGVLVSGNDVVDIGIASTPMAIWWAAQAGFDGGAVVTASHLAKEHNGFKLYAKQAKPLGAQNGLGEIRRVVEDESNGTTGSTTENTVKRGTISNQNVIPQYLTFLLSHLRPRRRLKIAIDAGHGAAGPEIAALVQAATTLVDVIVINTEPDGTFPTRTPNPLDKGCLDGLVQLILKEKCDFGVSLDGDADRAIFVDEKGKLVPTDLMIGLIGGELIERNGGGKIVYDLRASRSVPEYISTKGGEAIRTGVGTNFMIGSLKDSGALFAGELSGHYYYADMFNTDNALRTAMEAINVVAQSARPLSQLINPLSIYSTSGEINLRVAGAIAETLKRLEESIDQISSTNAAGTAGGAVDEPTKEHIDGLSVNFSQWWFAARGSQTEPLLRLTVGAVTPEILADKTEALIAIINKA